MSKLKIRSKFRRPVELRWPDTVFSYVISALGLCVFGAVFLLSTGCGGPEADPDPFNRNLEETDKSPSPISCSVLFSSGRDLMSYVSEAAARWSATTGCDISVADTGGIRFIGVDRVTGGKPGERVLGHTDRDKKGVVYQIRVEDDLGSAMMDLVTAHEMGHALGLPGHSDTGLMAEGSHDNIIDSSSLTLVCSVLDCYPMTPEPK